MVGWKDGHMNGRMGDGLVDRWKGYELVDGWMVGWINGYMDGWMDGWLDG
jgi:hypothetical protein